MGEEFRQRRESLGLSQTAVGNAAGISYQTVKNIERGKTSSARSVASLARALEQFESGIVSTSIIEVPESDLRAVLDEIRALRRLHEDDRAQFASLVDRVEALAARIESR